MLIQLFMRNPGLLFPFFQSSIPSVLALIFMLVASRLQDDFHSFNMWKPHLIQEGKWGKWTRPVASALFYQKRKTLPPKVIPCTHPSPPLPSFQGLFSPFHLLMLHWPELCEIITLTCLTCIGI